MATLNRIERGSIRRDGDGWLVEEHALVEGVTGNARARQYNAITAPGIPAHGTAHPAVPDVFLETIEARPESGSTSKFDVTLIYRSPAGGAGGAGGARFGPATVELSSDVAQERVTQDINGNFLTVSFAGTATTYSWSGGILRATTRVWTRVDGVSTADVSRPQLVIRVSRFERDLPTTVAQQLTGAVNRSRWEVFPARTLLCASVNALPTEGGFDVTYLFRHNPETWQFRAEINLGFGAHPPREARVGNGIALYDVYPLYDFGSLRLSI